MKKQIRSVVLSLTVLSTSCMAIASVGGTSPTPQPPPPPPHITLPVIVGVILAWIGL